MNVLRKIDKWLIDRPYQGLVDFTGKASAWWAEQCACGVVLGAATRIASTDSVSGWHWVGLAFDLLIAASMLRASKLPPLLDYVGSWYLTRVGIVMVMAVSFPLAWARMTTLQTVSDAIYSAALLSFYYFAACKPPRPREPRRKVARGMA